MKNILPIIGAIFSITLRAFSAAPAEEARFLGAVKSAFEKKDTKAFLGLYCWDGVTDFIKSVAEETTPETLAFKVGSITLVNAAPGTTIEFVREGVTYRNNLKVTKQIEVTYSRESKLKVTGKIIIPVGEKDGKLFITTAAPAK
ncbi:MAG: hypothetical protein ABI042_03365 [Verrucomicrobiota bacterium]